MIALTVTGDARPDCSVTVTSPHPLNAAKGDVVSIHMEQRGVEFRHDLDVEEATLLCAEIARRLQAAGALF